MGIQEKDARFAAAFSDGIMKTALEFVNDEAVREERNKIIDVTRGLCSRDKINALLKVDYFMSNKDKIDYILDIMMSWFRDILIYKECGASSYLINLDKKDIIVEECPRFSSVSLNNIINSIKQTSSNIKANANFQLSIETMLLSIQEG
jgi:DNA polymerase-3 subunit delta'